MLRWAVLVALLVAELLFLTVTLDADALARTDTIWARLMVFAATIPRLTIAIGCAALLFGGSQLLRAPVALCVENGRRPSWWLYLVAHVVAYAIFAWVSAFVLQGEFQASSAQGAWVALWAFLMLLTLGLWFAAVIDPRLWGRLLQATYRVLLLAIGVGALAWGVGWLTSLFWEPLSASTFWTIHGLLKLEIANVVCEPDSLTLRLPNFWVEINHHCSGYEGIGLTWTFLAAYLWLFRDQLRFPQAWLLFPVATIVIWVANVLRITALVLIGAYVSPQLALGGFHSQAGWIAFNLVALGTIMLSTRMAWLRRDHAIPTYQRATAAYLMPFLVSVAVGIIGAAFLPDSPGMTIVRILAVALTLAAFRKQYHELGLPDWRWGIATGVAGALLYAIALAYVPYGMGGDRRQSVVPELAPVWLTLRAVAYVFIAPVVEELAFRGYLIRRLQAKDFLSVPPGQGTWFGMLASSVLFGLYHPTWLGGMAVGLLYAIVYRRRGQLRDSILAHAITNAILACYAVGMGRWEYWS